MWGLRQLWPEYKLTPDSNTSEVKKAYPDSGCRVGFGVEEVGHKDVVCPPGAKIRRHVDGDLLDNVRWALEFYTKLNQCNQYF
jgi:hypothetical protein